MSLAQQILSVPGVGRLSYQDEPLFQIAFSNTTPYYAHNWLYVLRASHSDSGELGFKYYSPELVAVIGIRNKYVYITPIADTTSGIKLNQLCSSILQTTGLRVVLKKIPSQILETNIAHKVTRGVPLEDDSLPETTLRLDKLFIGEEGTVNPAIKHVMRRAAAFGKKGKSLTAINDIRKVPLEALEHFLRPWPQKYRSYRPMLHYLHSLKEIPSHYYCTVFIEQQKVRGIYIIDRFALTEAGFYCGVTAKDEPGITEWMDVYFFRRLLLQGVTTVYLGGSERLGVAGFIHKLLPQTPPYAVRAGLYHKRAADGPAILVRPATERDITSLAVLYKQSYNELELLDEHWTKESAHKFISHFYRRQPDLFFVAEIDGKIVGAAVAAIQPWWDGNHLVEGEVFTNTNLSGQGIEKRLFHKLLTVARDTYSVVAWDTFMPVVQKHPFSAYKTIGFSEMPHRKAISGDTAVLLARLEDR